jgi:zinc transporter, ZIP family
MFTAFAWGAGAACSLIIGAAFALGWNIRRRTLGLIMAFGVGVLLSAVSFELLEEAFRSTHRALSLGVGLTAGALTFFTGDVLIDRMGGRAHRKPHGDASNGMAIFLGTILDGIPESIVLGLTLVKGGSISIAMVVAVFLSNLPEAIGATDGLQAGKWSVRRIMLLWVVVTVLSGAAAWLGFAVFDTANPDTLAFTLAFAGGALLTMLADSMMPQAFSDSGKLVGLVTTLGFGVAFMLTMLTK